MLRGIRVINFILFEWIPGFLAFLWIHSIMLMKDYGQLIVAVVALYVQHVRVGRKIEAAERRAEFRTMVSLPVSSVVDRIHDATEATLRWGRQPQTEAVADLFAQITTLMRRVNRLTTDMAASEFSINSDWLSVSTDPLSEQLEGLSTDDACDNAIEVSTALGDALDALEVALSAQKNLDWKTVTVNPSRSKAHPLRH